MDSTAIPIALKDRLGPEATDGLLQVMEQLEAHLREDVITASGSGRSSRSARSSA
jgi:hypothetical protein